MTGEALRVGTFLISEAHVFEWSLGAGFGALWHCWLDGCLPLYRILGYKSSPS
jgi:hypothetical protein